MDAFIDDVELISFLEETEDLPFVVVTGVEFAVCGSSGKFRIRAAVGEGVCDGVAGVPGGEHAAAVFIGIAGPELTPIDEFGSKNEGLNELLNSMHVAQVGEVVFSERKILGSLFGGGGTFVNVSEEFCDESGDHFVIGGSSLKTSLFKLLLPIRHAFVDDRLVKVTFFPVLADGAGDDFHLGFTVRLVDEWFVFFIVAMLLDLTTPLFHVAAEEGDPGLDLSGVVSEVEPLALALFDELFVIVASFFQTPHGSENEHQFIASRIGSMEGGFFYLTLRSGFLHDDLFEAGEQGLVLAAIDIDEDGLDEAVEISAAGFEDAVMPVLFRHEGGEGGEVTFVPLGQVFRHLNGSIFGVGDHRQEVTTIESGGIVVANSGVGGEEEGIGQVNASIVVANDGLTFAIDGFDGLVIEELVEFGIEDELADEPTSIGSVGFEVGIISGE